MTTPKMPGEEIPVQELLLHFHTLANSEAFMRFCVPDLLRENQGLLKELFLAALAHPTHRKDVQGTYRGHVTSGKIKPGKKKPAP